MGDGVTGGVPGTSAAESAGMGPSAGPAGGGPTGPNELNRRAVTGSYRKPDSFEGSDWQQLVKAQSELALGSVGLMNLIQPGMLERLGFTAGGDMSELDQLINQSLMSSLQGNLSPASQVSFDTMKDYGLQSTAVRGGMGGTGEAQLMGELMKSRATLGQQDQQLYSGLQNTRTSLATSGLGNLMNMRGGVMGQLGSGGAQEYNFAKKGWGIQNRQLDQNEPDMMGEMMGTMLPLIGMGLMMSDIRLKNNIEYL